ncbi:unnamed protein product, partial [Hymenolepis diminuta]
ASYIYLASIKTKVSILVKFYESFLDALVTSSSETGCVPPQTPSINVGPPPFLLYLHLTPTLYE